MILISIPPSFDDWRRAARSAIFDGLKPADILWNQPADLFVSERYQIKDAVMQMHVPRQFMEDASRACFVRDPERWNVLYRLLWRLQYEDRNLMMNLTDDDVITVNRWARAVGRDAHKMKAFVRFKQVEENTYVAWHKPDHFIVRLVAPFFQSRFSTMSWSIFTPDESVHWNREQLIFTEGVPTADGIVDNWENLWQTYYAHIFNPARIKLKAMTKEMPRRHWQTMPETRMIETMLEAAPLRVQQMLKWQPPSLEQYIAQNAKTSSLEEIRAMASACRHCPLHQNATRTVFGEGPADASIVIIGEQPGDVEDLLGRPFVGPAGQLLDEAMQIVGLDRGKIYLTNAVKHFKWEPGVDNKRLHKNPDAREIAICKAWLDRELKIIRPRLTICLGASAAQAILGRVIQIKDLRGKLLPAPHGGQMLVTAHPASILRADDRKGTAWLQFLDDLRIVVEN